MVRREGRATSSETEKEVGAGIRYSKAWSRRWTEIEVSFGHQTVRDKADKEAISRDGKVCI